MSRKTWGVVGLGTTLFAIGWFLFFREKPRTPSEDHARAAFTRPTTLSDSSEGFSIQIAGVDGLKDVPAIECGTKTMLEVVLPRKSGRVFEVLFVVPRLPSQGEEGFRWIDSQGCDLFLGLSRDGRREELHKNKYSLKERFNLRAGEYRVRYYRQTMNVDAEQGPPVTELLGEGRLMVVTPKSGDADCGFLPLSSDKHKMPLFVTNEESKR